MAIIASFTSDPSLCLSSKLNSTMIGRRNQVDSLDARRHVGRHFPPRDVKSVNSSLALRLDRNKRLKNICNGKFGIKGSGRLNDLK